jgi:hypothetical protein
MPNSPAKRQRERVRLDRQREKERRRDSRRGKPDRPSTPGVDPDIAGIVPGPQPILEDQ